MALSIVLSATLRGVEALPVRVEVHLSNGLPAFALVGLPEAAVRESRERVRSALLNSGFQFPAGRITVNLAPADLPKNGGGYDLPIALGILAASGQLDAENLQNALCFAELALSGDLRSVDGLLPVALYARSEGLRLLGASASWPEISRLDRLRYGLEGSLAAIVQRLRKAEHPSSCWRADPPGAAHGEGRRRVPATSSSLASRPAWPDLSDVVGQATACRAAEVALAGAHHLLLSGPPGTGKTLLVQCMAGMLPPLQEDIALEVATLYSVAGIPRGPENWLQAPVRMPHHSASSTALLGGTSRPRPGEISLAHGGMLFLDELTEFRREVLDGLREPIEAGEIHLARAAARATFPAGFMLVAGMNPCPCGHAGSSGQRCHCSPREIARYRERLSGPLLDRFDLGVVMTEVTPGECMRLLDGRGSSRKSQAGLAMAPHGANSASTAGNRPASAHSERTTTPIESERFGGESARAKARVLAARRRQYQRQHCLNGRLDGAALRQHAVLDAQARIVLEQGVSRLGLSMRGIARVRRVARTLADLERAELIGPRHVMEALVLRVQPWRRSQSVDRHGPRSLSG